MILSRLSAAAGGEPDVVEKCLKGSQFRHEDLKVHLDGYNLLPFFKGEVKERTAERIRVLER